MQWNVRCEGFRAEAARIMSNRSGHREQTIPRRTSAIAPAKQRFPAINPIVARGSQGSDEENR